MALLFITFFTSCQRPSQVVIFATNDMHGHIEHFARIAAIVEAERAVNPNVLLVSAGDKFTGNPDVDQYPEKGYPIVELMNQSGYQYETFGNHEFDYGQQVLLKRQHQARFRSLSANIVVDTAVSVLAQPDPYALFRMGRIRVALLGLSQCSPQDDGTWRPAAHPDRLQGLTFRDPIATALEFRPLRDRCDLFVALTHIGADRDTALANAMPELDVIVGGHSHTYIDSTFLVNDVLVTQAQHWTNYLGKTTITFRGRHIVDRQYELIPLNDDTLPEDATVLALQTQFIDNSPLDDPLAVVTEQFSGKEAISTFMTDALTTMLGCDIALQNSGGVRIGEIRRGPITMRTVYEVDPFCNDIIIFHMAPTELRSLLEGSYRTACMRADLLPAGITYTIHTHGGHFRSIDIRDMEGKPLDESRTYSVAMNSYIASSYTFLHADPGTKSGGTAEDYVIDYLREKGTIAPQPRRTFVVEE